MSKKWKQLQQGNDIPYWKQKNINPVKFGSYERFKTIIDTNSRVLATNRYVWEGLPDYLTSTQLENALYDYGVICCVLYKEEPLFCTFAPTGKLNLYGQLDKIQPISFSGVSLKEVNNIQFKDPEKANFGVYCFDRSTPLYNTYLNCSRDLFQPINEAESKILNKLCAVISVSMKKVVAIADNKDMVDSINQQVKQVLDDDNPILMLTSGSNIHDILHSFDLGDMDVQEYTHAIDYFDKIRRLFMGVPAPDTFEKKERKITSEANDATKHSDLVLNDGLYQRKMFCEQMNKYLNTNLSVQINEVLQ